MQSFEMNQLHLKATILFSIILGANAFSYKDAKNWGKKYSKCNGKHQSPIPFMTPVLNDHQNYNKTLKLTDFDQLPNKLTIANTGHTVEMKADWSGEPPTCSAGPLDGNYVFEKATFHWAQKTWTQEVASKDNGKDYYMYDMEMHMFFYKADLKSFEKAQKQKGGLAVFNMGFLSEPYTNECLFDNLERSLHKVRSPNSTAEIPPFRFASIFDETTKVCSIYFYEGSLDYPPCSESVSWFIVGEIGYITNGLIHQLRKIKLAEGDVTNIRPPQALNKRQIMMVYNHKGHDDLKQFFNSEYNSDQ